MNFEQVWENGLLAYGCASCADSHGEDLQELDNTASAREWAVVAGPASLALATMAVTVSAAVLAGSDDVGVSKDDLARVREVARMARDRKAAMAALEGALAAMAALEGASNLLVANAAEKIRVAAAAWAAGPSEYGCDYVALRAAASATLHAIWAAKKAANAAYDHAGEIREAAMRAASR
jgi:hypothetical protein